MQNSNLGLMVGLILLGLVAGGGLGYYVGYQKGKVAATVQAVEENPFADVKTNPLEDVKTNPLKDVKTNPFE